MSSLGPPGKFLMLAEVFVVVLGLLAMFWSKVPFLDRLPGGIFLQKESFRFFFPIVTCLLTSAVLTLLSTSYSVAWQVG